MKISKLFKVGYNADCSTEPFEQLVRARTPQEAAEIVHEFLMHEFDKPIVCQLLTVQLLHEPEDGIGMVFEPAGEDTQFTVMDGRLTPIIETPIE